MVAKTAALAAVVLLAAGCGGGGGGGGANAPSGIDGKTLFVQQCGACHTLADAGTRGSYGADLERNTPTKAKVLQLIDEGKGTMPAHILGGSDAEKVAAYVARAVRR